MGENQADGRAAVRREAELECCGVPGNVVNLWEVEEARNGFSWNLH